MLRFCKRLKEKAEDRFARPVIYVALGDSVTQGFREHDPAGSPLYHEDVYHAQFQRRVHAQFPGTVLSVINAGVACDTAQGGLSRLKRDVLAFDPDLVTVSFGLNDSGAGIEGLEIYASSLRRMAEEIRGQTKADLVFITPNMMLTGVNPNIHKNQRELVAPMIKRSQEGIVDAYAKTMRAVARELDIPIVDAFSVWRRWESGGRDINLLLANGTNHPGEEGHELVARLLFEILKAYSGNMYRPKHSQLENLRECNS